MEIRFNGEPLVVAAETVQGLLAELALEDKKLAVELNRCIVPRAAYSSTTIAAGDEVEIVQFVGGG